MKIFQSKDKVEDLLSRDQRTRDNDDLLIARLWWDELPEALKTEHVRQFLSFMSGNNLTTVESIVRARRKIQETRQDLRGDKYKNRKSEEFKVKQEVINYR